MPVGQRDRSPDDGSELLQVLVMGGVADAEDALQPAEKVLEQVSRAAQLSVVLFLEFSEFAAGFALGGEDGSWTCSYDCNFSEVREFRTMSDATAALKNMKSGSPDESKLGFPCIRP
jgi:hypothetical protein